MNSETESDSEYEAAASTFPVPAKASSSTESSRTKTLFKKQKPSRAHSVTESDTDDEHVMYQVECLRQRIVKRAKLCKIVASKSQCEATFSTNELSA